MMDGVTFSVVLASSAVGLVVGAFVALSNLLASLDDEVETQQRKVRDS